MMKFAGLIFANSAVGGYGLKDPFKWEDSLEGKIYESVVNGGRGLAGKLALRKKPHYEVLECGEEYGLLQSGGEESQGSTVVMEGTNHTQDFAGPETEATQISGEVTTPQGVVLKFNHSLKEFQILRDYLIQNFRLFVPITLEGRCNVSLHESPQEWLQAIVEHGSHMAPCYEDFFESPGEANAKKCEIEKVAPDSGKYQIITNVAADGTTSIVHRKYQEFVKLRTVLKRDYRNRLKFLEVNTPFPKRALISPFQKDKFAHVKLAEWLRAVAEKMPVSQELHKFLGVEIETPVLDESDAESTCVKSSPASTPTTVPSLPINTWNSLFAGRIC